MALTLTTTAFTPGGDIPARFTCDGDDVSPALRWEGVPEGTRSFALVMDDPDAPRGTWQHWLLYHLPPATRDLPEDMPADESLPSGARQGRNDFGKPGYGGPCPPAGPAHRYYFRLYALDVVPDVKAGATRSALDRAIRGHILAEAELMGRYRRR
jgi:Raf kinase inhibitor-like YbhB/YbcL family protein